MTASETRSENVGEAWGLRRAVTRTVQQFCEECDRFIAWQYREIIAGEPSAERTATHRGELKWALRTAKLLECVASDPDSANAADLALLRAKIWQLERSWKSLYEAIPEEEAARILTEVFPDESRA